MRSGAMAWQDVGFCAERFPDLRCRPVAAQAMAGDVIALFELVLQVNELRVKQARHYRLVSALPYRPAQAAV